MMLIGHQELTDDDELKWPLIALLYIWFALDPVAYKDDIFATLER